MWFFCKKQHPIIACFAALVILFSLLSPFSSTSASAKSSDALINGQSQVIAGNTVTLVVSKDTLDDSGYYYYHGLDVAIFEQMPDGTFQVKSGHFRRDLSRSLSVQLDLGQTSDYEADKTYKIGYRVLYGGVGSNPGYVLAGAMNNGKNGWKLLKNGTQDVTFRVGTPEVVLSKIQVTVGENGATDSYTVRLTTKPADKVTVDVQAGKGLVVKPAQLTFDAGNWNVPQTVTVVAKDDDTAQGSRMQDITHTVSSSDPTYDEMSVHSIGATIHDNDTPGISLSDYILTVKEGKGADMTVRLNSRPTDNVTAAMDIKGKGIEILPSTLTFTPANWSKPQKLTVKALKNKKWENPRNGTIHFTFNSTDPDYDVIKTELYVHVADTTGPSDLELKVHDKTDTSVKLGFSAMDPSGIQGYQLKRGNKTITKWLPAGYTEHTDTGLQPDHSYTYTLIAKDTAGNTSEEKTTVKTNQKQDNNPGGGSKNPGDDGDNGSGDSDNSGSEGSDNQGSGGSGNNGSGDSGNHGTGGSGNKGSDGSGGHGSDGNGTDNGFGTGKDNGSDNVTPVLDNDADKTNGQQDEDDGSGLPQTATNLYNWLLAGAALLLIGLIILRFRRGNKDRQA